MIDTRAGHLKRSLSISATDAGCCTLTTLGSRLYINNSFNKIAETRRPNLTTLDHTSLHTLPWNPRANNSINSLTTAQNTVWIADPFTRIGGTHHAQLTALDT